MEFCLEEMTQDSVSVSRCQEPVWCWSRQWRVSMSGAMSVWPFIVVASLTPKLSTLALKVRNKLGVNWDMTGHCCQSVRRHSLSWCCIDLSLSPPPSPSPSLSLSLSLLSRWTIGRNLYNYFLQIGLYCKPLSRSHLWSSTLAKKTATTIMHKIKTLFLS